ncbi:MAG TPA: amidohydrolase family protein, partial [Sphingomicrobium sp.]
TERADYSHEQHGAWTHSNTYFGDMKPSEVFRRNFTSCFIDDAYGLRNLDLIGEDRVMFETDYPHSDTPWPNAPEVLWKSIQHLGDEAIDKITHLNAMREFKFDPFKENTRQTLNVGALRAKAKAKGVDTSIKSQAGGERPADVGTPRIVTSGDVMAMFTRHAEPADA